ncbi:MAG: RNA polymerase factor sigma-54 [Acidobacteriales bacterium]|nr:RNA polymerase factor sigma-54 [Terriglobales bacterium]
MVLLQNKLSLRVSQKQILTPGLVQMVSVLALNKLELKDMITAEMVENPVLDELELTVPSLEEVAAKEQDRDRQEPEEPAKTEAEGDPFDEVDFGSFFKDYLDPGYRTHTEMEDLERPSFENFLSRPTTLTDHLLWQLGSLSLTREVSEVAELIVGNLNEDGYLIASDDELTGGTITLEGEKLRSAEGPAAANGDMPETVVLNHGAVAKTVAPETMQEALRVVRTLDPMGVGARDLRECLLLQLQALQSQYEKAAHGANGQGQVLADAIAIVDQHLKLLQNKQFKEIARALRRPLEEVMRAFEFIRSLDPKPGLRYNKVQTRLIEPDVAFVKQGDQWIVVMNDEDMPQLRLNPTYKRLMAKNAAEKDVRNYVKERYKSAIMLIKNIEQRKQTIIKVCYCIIERQRDFLEHGIDQLRPMMIKDVAEEIGVHPSTVSRAVANKYTHTPQGVFELRYFFTESVNGPEGGGMSLLNLKRRVKRLIEDEDPRKPLTDDQITRILQSEGIQVTRRTVAKYREDLKIPSTHQRRDKN